MSDKNSSESCSRTFIFWASKHIIFSDLKKKLRNVWQSIHDFLHERSLLHKLTLPLTVSLEGIKGGNWRNSSWRQAELQVGKPLTCVITHTPRHCQIHYPTQSQPATPASITLFRIDHDLVLRCDKYHHVQAFKQQLLKCTVTVLLL